MEIAHVRVAHAEQSEVGCGRGFLDESFEITDGLVPVFKAYVVASEVALGETVAFVEFKGILGGGYSTSHAIECIQRDAEISPPTLFFRSQFGRPT